MKPKAEPVFADEIDLRIAEAQEEAHELRTERARVGSVAREIDLRELLRQHRSAYSAFLTAVQLMRHSSEKHGEVAVWGFARTHFLADIYALGLASSDASKWRIETELRSPIYFTRLMGGGSAGELERQWFASYVAEHFVFPAFKGLWRQLGGADEAPRPV